jgi:hypothetical protein
MFRSAAWPAAAAAVDVAAVSAAVGRPGAAPTDRLAAARALADSTPPLAAGTAVRVFATLAAVAAEDVALARTVEPHLDALSVLAQAGIDAPADSTWGVFAAEGPGLQLDAHRTADAGPDPFLLTGTKPWCSLASTLSHALVTAHVGADRQLFAVDLRHEGVHAHDEAWVARGMPDIPSGPVDFRAVPAHAVGDPGWYLHRPGFAWGGIGVAACWWGGALGLARVLRDHAAARPDSDLLRAALGAVVADLADAEDAVAGAARRIDASAVRTASAGTDASDGATAEAAATPDEDWALLAQVVRSRVRRAVDAVTARVVGAIGPGPLTSDPAVAARVADLGLYVLQDHGERDLARIGRIVLERGGVAW